ncbi:MAG: endonuclease/exonuclease/phosphatase family protein [Mariniphaga sp.]|nr:endonuclease/exonuclease/phosphatase family protein [Mariniphaga sp.]
MNFKRIISKGFLLGLLVAMIFSCQKNNDISRKKLTVVFYNVENLFDLEDEPGKSDEEFTPEGSKEWTQERLDKKLNDLSKVLSSVNKTELPEIIGLCEVENKKVLMDLVETDLLKARNYKIVHYESPDFRGIDNALIYRSDEFTVEESKPVKVVFENDQDYVTRDILYVKGKTTNREILHIFVNHWPSRIGGEAETEPKRVKVASIIKSMVDSIQIAEKNPNIIVLGDMNDEPINKSMINILGAKDPLVEPQAKLQNLMFEIDKQNLGSYNYQGNWNMLDNIIVSESLLDNKGFTCSDKQGYVFHEEWMEFKNREGEMSPNRTYGGSNYYGGISDHFPVYIILER